MVPKQVLEEALVQVPESVEILREFENASFQLPSDNNILIILLSL